MSIIEDILEKVAHDEPITHAERHAVWEHRLWLGERERLNRAFDQLNQNADVMIRLEQEQV